MTNTIEVPPGAGAALPPHRITVATYVKIYDAVVAPGNRVELIHGVMVRKMTIHAPHTRATIKLSNRLYALCPAGWHVRTQQPIVASEESAPEPDVAVAAGSVDDYPTAQPTAAQTALVVEVADSSLAFDLGVKAALYAAARIPEYWVVDLANRVVHVHTLPRRGKNPGYKSVIVVDAAGVIPLTLRGEALGPVAVSEFLP